MSSNMNEIKIETDKLIKYVRESTKWMEVLKKCGYKSISQRGTREKLIKQLDVLGIDYSHLKVRTFTERIEIIPIEELNCYISNNSLNWMEICHKYNYLYTGNNVEKIKARLNVLGIDYSHIEDYRFPFRKVSTDDLKKIVSMCKTWSEFAYVCSYRRHTKENREIIIKVLDKNKIDYSHLLINPSRARGKINFIETKELETYTKESKTWNNLIKKCGYQLNTKQTREMIKMVLDENNIDHSHLTNKVVSQISLGKNSLSKEEYKEIVSNTTHWTDVCKKIGYSHNNPRIREKIMGKLDSLGIDYSHLQYIKYNKKGQSNISLISDELFIKYVKESTTWRELYQKCGYKNNYSSRAILFRIIKLGVDPSHLVTESKKFNKKGKKYYYSLEDILIENSPYNNNYTLKIRLVKELGWELRCSRCNLDEWLGQPIPIDLDHINGDHYDNRIENLRFLCRNCHGLTDTFCGKNKKQLKEQKINKCIECNKQITPKATRCKSCHNTQPKYHNRKVKNRPTLKELENDLKTSNYVQVGRKYGVSDNAIKKWMKQYKKGNKSNII